MILPTLQRGFKLAYGSWKIIWILLCNSLASLPLTVAISRPLISTLPKVGLWRPTSILAVVDFPQPLSPTKERVSPLRISKETPSTAFSIVLGFLSISLFNKGAETSKYFPMFSTLTRTLCWVLASTGIG